MTDFDSTLRWPLETDGWTHTVLVGALFVATLPLVIPGVLLAGYAVRLLRADPDDPLPDFGDLRSLAATGVRAAGIVAAYTLPAAALIAAGATGLTSASAGWRTPFLARPASVVGAVDLAGLTAAAVAAVAGTVLLPACGYAATVAVTAYASTDDVTEAFAPGRIGRRIRSTATLRAWLLASLVAVGVGVCAALLGGVATAIPGVGSLLVAAVQFYGGLVATGVWNATRPAGDSTVGSVGTGDSAAADPA
jgi:hypothetical protein